MSDRWVSKTWPLHPRGRCEPATIMKPEAISQASKDTCQDSIHRVPRGDWARTGGAAFPKAEHQFGKTESSRDDGEDDRLSV